MPLPSALTKLGPDGGSPDQGGSLWSSLSYQSLFSSGSSWSVASVGSSLSIASVGSFLSIGSAGSFLSIGSVFSAASIGSALSFGSIGGLLASGAEPGGPPGAGTVRLARALALAALAAAVLPGRAPAAA